MTHLQQKARNYAEAQAGFQDAATIAQNTSLILRLLRDIVRTELVAVRRIIRNQQRITKSQIVQRAFDRVLAKLEVRGK